MERSEEDGRFRDRRRFTVQMALALLGGAAVTIGCGGGANETIDRRHFRIPAALALLLGASIAIGCGGGGGGSPTSPTSPTVRASPTPDPNAPALCAG